MSNPTRSEVLHQLFPAARHRGMTQEEAYGIHQLTKRIPPENRHAALALIEDATRIFDEARAETGNGFLIVSAEDPEAEFVFMPISAYQAMVDSAVERGEPPTEVTRMTVEWYESFGLIDWIPLSIIGYPCDLTKATNLLMMRLHFPRSLQSTLLHLLP